MARKLFITSALALASALLLGACKAADTAGSSATSKAAANSSAAASSGAAAQAGGAGGGGTTTVSADGARRVTPAELQKMVEGGGVVIYDTRSKGAYDAEHIKGALSMPHDEVEKRVAEFPKDKTLVFYCTWPAEQSSAGAALKLKSKGIEDTAALVGGMGAWKNAGLPTEGSAVK